MRERDSAAPPRFTMPRCRVRRRARTPSALGEGAGVAGGRVRDTRPLPGLELGLGLGLVLELGLGARRHSPPTG